MDKDISEDDPVRVENAIIDSLDIDGFSNHYSDLGRLLYEPRIEARRSQLMLQDKHFSNLCED